MTAQYEGFESFYRANHARLIGSLAVVVGDVDLARESTDEAFARALLHWTRVERMPSRAGWLYRVALNVARRRQRRRAMEVRLLRTLETAAVLDGPAGETWEAVKELPDRQRTVTVLRYVADLTEPEIGRALGISRSSVSTALTAARRRLETQLREEPVSLGGRHA